MKLNKYKLLFMHIIKRLDTHIYICSEQTIWIHFVIDVFISAVSKSTLESKSQKWLWIVSNFLSALQETWHQRKKNLTFFSLQK